jgi:hypothetical protein
MIALACALGAAGLTGCPGPGGAVPPPANPEEAAHSTLADEDAYKPSYGKAELQRALISERGTEASLERRVADLEARQETTTNQAFDDQLRVAIADLAVRRRFIASLEACESAGRWCPPRLDDPPWAYDSDADPPAEPPLSAALRFDLDSWRTIAAELHGRACACRTLGCVDSVEVALDELEPRPMPTVRSDEESAVELTRARECLTRLRGRAIVRTASPAAPAAE